MQLTARGTVCGHGCFVASLDPIRRVRRAAGAYIVGEGGERGEEGEGRV